MQIARRSLLAAASLSAAPRAAWANGLSRGVFTHGVASGDPLADGFIIWTRFVGGNGRIAWEIAEDEAFTRVVQRGEAGAAFANDFCVKADVRGLAPARHYFYRFLSASGPSLTGRTRTAGGDSLSVALFSCANFAFGYFHAYGHAAAREDVDLAIHTGDYIYEYRRGVYPDDDDAIAARIIDPVGETVRLEDYYQRYATYHADPDLQELRRLKPLAVVWDDHEIANEAWRAGAQNHSERYEGAFADRIAAASKAYFDWMPIRRPAPGARLYRALDWGALARIILLDARYIGRDEQLDYRRSLWRPLREGGAAASAAVETFRRDALANPDRTMLGAEQERWLSQTLSGSKDSGQVWQIIAQQVVLGEQFMAPNAPALMPEGAAAISRRYMEAAAQLGQLGMPWNLDSWGGYPAARARLLDACAHRANNAIVLSGDSHNCWLNSLEAPGAHRLAAIEFAGGSVSSPGLERSLSNAAAGEREQAMRSANPPLAFCDLAHRGYGALHFTPRACEAEWVAFADVRSPIAAPPTRTRINAEASTTAGPGPWTL